jgi:tRNA (mo5U34)-methyltransferase
MGHMGGNDMENLIQDQSELGLTFMGDGLASFVRSLRAQLDADYGNEKLWRDVVALLPSVETGFKDYHGDRVVIGSEAEMSPENRETLIRCMKKLSPWRKGPFDLFGVPLDCEWASNIKWDRLKDRIGSLRGKRVFDVGCSSGYYMYRMLAEDPFMVLGIDPQVLYYHQFLLIQHFAKAKNLYYLPAKLEDLPEFTDYFDTVFFMGVIYHRKSPVDTLSELRKSMIKGGELVIETLVIEGDEPHALFPEDRYASMRNVFFIPTIACLSSWLKRTKFGDIRVVDVSPTTLDEQRTTPFSGVLSLESYLDPNDPSKTIEGYPAPVRAMVIAKAV